MKTYLSVIALFFIFVFAFCSIYFYATPYPKTSTEWTTFSNFMNSMLSPLLSFSWIIITVWIALMVKKYTEDINNKQNDHQKNMIISQLAYKALIDLATELDSIKCISSDSKGNTITNFKMAINDFKEKNGFLFPEINNAFIQIENYLLELEHSNPGIVEMNQLRFERSDLYKKLGEIILRLPNKEIKSKPSTSCIKLFLRKRWR